MADLEIRPTMRFIMIRYIVTDLLLVAAVIWWSMERNDPSLGKVALAAVIAAAVLMAWPVSQHVKRQRIRCRLEGGQLRYESGLLTTTLKTLPVDNIQDVTVRRTMLQKMFGVGDLRIETAGKGSALEIANVENPQRSADVILAATAKPNTARQGSNQT